MNKMKKGKLTTVLLIAGPALIIAAAAYLYFKSKAAGINLSFGGNKTGSSSSGLNVGNTSGGTSSSSSGFPIIMGSSGPLVTQLQNALIAAYGASVLPNYGADGKFGVETQSALGNVWLGPITDQSDYNIVMQDLQAVATDNGNTAAFNQIISANSLATVIGQVGGG